MRVAQALTRGWRGAVMVVLAAGVGLVLARAAAWTPVGHVSTLRFDRLEGLPIAATHSVVLVPETQRLRVTGPDPYIVLRRGILPKGVRSARLRIRPVTPPRDRAFALYYIPPDRRGSAFSEDWNVPGTLAESPNEWMVRWGLPSQADEARLDFPEGGEYEFHELSLSDAEVLRAELGGVVGRVLVLAASWLLVLIAVAYALGVQPPTLAAAKQLLVGSLLLPIVVMTFLLPPFQAPDEDGAWKLALVHYRGTIYDEPALFYLPEVVGAHAIKFHPDVRMAAERLRATEYGVVPTREQVDAEYLGVQRSYKYGRWYAYPVVWVVGVFFPTVRNVQQALIFYYFCRLTTGLLFVAVLEMFRRRYDLPLVAIAFFALPLVVQQFVGVSVDTELNLGAIAAVFLFIRAAERPSMAADVGLTALVTALSAVKFTYAGLLLLPLALAIRRRPRPHPAALAAALAVAIAGGYLAMRIVLAFSRDYAVHVGTVASFDAQLAALHTSRGWSDFLAAYWWLVKRTARLVTWAGPLGWLDTGLSDDHEALIAGSFAAAIVFDLITYARPLRDALRTRAADLALVAGVIAAMFAIASTTNSIVFYLVTTPPGAHFIAGTQGRHLAYTAIAAVLLPMWVVRGSDSPQSTTPTMWATAATLVVGLLLAAGGIALAIDLLVRYW